MKELIYRNLPDVYSQMNISELEEWFTDYLIKYKDKK